MKALIDADILVYRIGFTTEDVDEGIAAWRMDETIDGIKEALKTNEYEPYLTSTDHSNYRYKLFPDYKANRKQPKPKHYDFLRTYLTDNHGAQVVFGMEADDQLGIGQDDRSVIVSIDKDLNQIPGHHFNFVKGLLYEVSPEEGLRYFYHQLLTGDRGDNIPGIHGIGPKTAEKILNGYHTEMDLWKAVLFEWQKQPTFDLMEVIRNGRLLKIRQQEDEPLWEPPV